MRRLLVLPLLATLLSACATQPAEAPPPGYDYTYAPYGYYDVPPWDPYYDPWFGPGYDDFGYCCGWGPGFYGFYGGGGYYHGWGHGGAYPGWGHPGGFGGGHGPGWGRAPWGGGGPFHHALPPGAGRGGFRPHYVPHASHGFSHYHR